MVRIFSTKLHFSLVLKEFLISKPDYNIYTVLSYKFSVKLYDPKINKITIEKLAFLMKFLQNPGYSSNHTNN
jgi:hypothetical protein